MPIVQQKTQKERQCIPQSCCAPAPQSPLQGWPLNRWDVGGTSEGPGTAPACKDLTALLRNHRRGLELTREGLGEKGDADAPGVQSTG